MGELVDLFVLTKQTRTRSASHDGLAGFPQYPSMLFEIPFKLVAPYPVLCPTPWVHKPVFVLSHTGHDVPKEPSMSNFYWPVFHFNLAPILTLCSFKWLCIVLDAGSLNQPDMDQRI